MVYGIGLDFFRVCRLRPYTRLHNAIAHTTWHRIVSSFLRSEMLNNDHFTLRQNSARFMDNPNNPFMGGSHLPDITVITPVFLDGSILYH